MSMIALRFALLAEIRREPGVCTKDLIGLTTFSAPIVRRQLAMLEEKGFIYPRGTGWMLTEKGSHVGTGGAACSPREIPEGGL